MLIAMAVSARWVIRRFHVKATFGSTISMGLVALGILVPAELAGVVWVRGLLLPEYMASFMTVPGLVSLHMFVLFAAMPARDASRVGMAWVRFLDRSLVSAMASQPIEASRPVPGPLRQDTQNRASRPLRWPLARVLDFQWVGARKPKSACTGSRVDYTPCGKLMRRTVRRLRFRCLL
jgi:hypothetical protein